MAANLNFYRGLKEKYSQETHADGVYFSTDTFEILMNGDSYGGSSIANAVFQEGKIIITFRDKTSLEIPISEATQTLPGLLSAADKTKLDNLPTGDSISQDLNDLKQKVGDNVYTDSNYLTEETNLTEAALKLDEQLKEVSDSLNTLDQSAVKGIQVNGTSISPSSGIVNIPNASTTVDGAMSKEDKTKLDKVLDTGGGTKYLADDGVYKTLDKNTVGLGNVDNTSDMAKPVSTAQQAAIDAVQKTATDHIADKNNPHEVTKEQVGLGNVTNDAQVKRTEMGVANGVATLDENGKIPVSQLNGQLASVQGVDEVVTSSTLPSQPVSQYMVWCIDDNKFREYNGTGWDVIDPRADTIYNFRNSDATGSTSRTNILYRWDGSALVEISSSLALGETNGTAYEGSKGKKLADALATSPKVVLSRLKSVNYQPDKATIILGKYDFKADGSGYEAEGDAEPVDITSATPTQSGLMSASDKTKLDKVLDNGDGTKYLADDGTYKTIDVSGDISSAFDSHTVNGKALSSNPVLNGGDILLDGFQEAEAQADITATDSTNVALGKLQKLGKDNKQSVSSIQNTVGLESDLTLPDLSGTNYLTESATVVACLQALDTALKTVADQAATITDLEARVQALETALTLKTV